MQRRIYLGICATAFVVFVVLGRNAFFKSRFDSRMTALNESISQIEDNLVREKKSIDRDVDSYLRDVEKKSAAATREAQQKAADRQKSFEMEKTMLDREIAVRGQVVGSFGFAVDSGYPELADDLVRLEQGLARLRAESEHLKCLHEAFNKRKFLSRSIIYADKAVTDIESGISYAEKKLGEAMNLSTHVNSMEKGL